MSVLHIILPILVGAVIGYCTNYIAIKMLFHPYNAVCIGKRQLPFTPGIIPKNQKRLANAVGDAVAEQLLTKEAVVESVGEACEKSLSGMAEKIWSSDMSVMNLLPKDGKGEEIIDSVSDSLSETLIERVEQIDLDAIIAKFGEEAILSLRSSIPMLSLVLTPDIQNRIFNKLGTAARAYIQEHGQTAAKEFISSYIRELSNKPIGEFVSQKEEQERLQAALERAVRNAVAKYGANFLEQINIREIVTQRIETMDMAELEALTMSVMKQELQAVINLGAIIGAVIGIVNIFL